MAAPFLNRNSVVLIKAEATYGTDSVPVVATDGLLTTIPQVALNAAILERMITIGTLSPTQPIIGKKLVDLTFSAELKSETAALDGVSSNPIQIDDLLRMSGWSPTYTVETAPPSSNDGFVVYAPISSAIESASVYCFPGKEVRHRITGAYADLVIEAAAGGYAMINAAIKGIYNEPTDTAAATPTYATDVPVPIESIALAFGAVTAKVIRNFTLAFNNEIVERADVNSAEGFKGLRIAGRKPTMKFRVEKELVATWNIYNALDIGTTYNTTMTIGSTSGQKVLITIPKFTLTSIKEADDAGIVVLDVEGLCARNSSAGNDELTFKFF